MLFISESRIPKCHMLFELRNDILEFTVTVEGMMVWPWAITHETLLSVCKQLYFLNYNPMVQDHFSGLCFAVHFVARQVHGQIVTEAIGMRMLVSEFV